MFEETLETGFQLFYHILKMTEDITRSDEIHSQIKPKNNLVFMV